MSHWIFAQEALRVLEYRDWARADIITAGSQGTDPYFFCGKRPWIPRPTNARIAHERNFAARMHERHPSALFAPLLDSARDQETLSLAFGFLLHWHLDRHVHPYVFSRSGFDASGGLSPPWNIEHTRFEFALDTVLVREYRQKFPAAGIPRPWACFALSRNTRTALSAWLASVFPGKTGKVTYREGLEDYAGILQVLDDPSGLKYRLACKAGLMNSYIGVLIHPLDVRAEDTDALLNRTRKDWPDPVTGAERKEGLLDIWDAAGKELPRLVDLFERTRSGGYASCSGEWDAFYRNQNHDGCPPDGSLRFMRPVRLQSGI